MSNKGIFEVEYMFEEFERMILNGFNEHNRYGKYCYEIRENYPTKQDIMYKEHIKYYIKQEFKGHITIETNEDSICSCFILKEGDTKVTSICNIPPCEKTDVFIDDDYNLYVYNDAGGVKIKPKKIENLNPFLKKVFDILILVIFFGVPIIFGLLTMKISQRWFDLFTYIFNTIWIIVFLYFIDMPQRKIKRLNKSKSIFFAGFKAGIRSSIDQSEQQFNN